MKRVADSRPRRSRLHTHPRTCAAAVVLSIALGALAGLAAPQRSANDHTSSGTIPSIRMADGKEWTTTNLNVNVQPSYCYDDADAVDMVACTRGSLPDRRADRSEAIGVCRRMTNGGSWRRGTGALWMIRLTKVEQRSPRC